MMNLYGVDLKITPEEKPVLIEVNGRGSGTEGFVNVYGDFRVQKKILSRMAEKADGNGIYMSYMSESVLSLLKRIPSLIYYGYILWFGEVKRIRSIREYAPQMDWFFDHNPSLPKFSRRDPRQSYLEAAEKLGIDLHPYSTMIPEDKNTLAVHYSRGIKKKHRGKERITPDDPGLIWSTKPIDPELRRGNEQNFLGPTPFDQKLVNAFPIQNFLQTKSYIHELLSDTEFSDFLPKTKLFGAGLTRTDFDIETSKFVKKPNSSSLGYGLRIYPRSMLRRLFEESRPKEENKRILDLFEKVVKIKHSPSYYNLIDFLKFSTSLIQEFVPSKPIHSDITGEEHDGCLRAIVVGGKFIDAYWRLSPQPLNGDESIENLRRKYGANLSQEAIPQRISQSDREIVEPFSESLINTLEERINIHSIKDFHSWILFETTYWAQKLNLKMN